MKRLIACVMVLTCLAVTAKETKETGAKSKTVKVFLLGGQSNMAGIGSVSKLKAPYTETSTTVTAFLDGKWQFLKPGMLDKKKKGTRFGPEVSFAHSMGLAYPSEDIRLVKYAVGGTNLYQQWSPKTKGKQYLGFMKHARAAIQDLEKSGTKYEIAGMLWLQGEADANKGKGDLYETNLTAFITHMRKEFKTPEMPFILARIRDHFGKESGHNKMVRDAQEKVADEMKNVTCFDTDDCSMKNAGHYNAAGYVVIGKRFTEAYQNPDQPLEQMEPGEKKEDPKKKKKKKKKKKSKKNKKEKKN